jgi:hypothetical protein
MSMDLDAARDALSRGDLAELRRRTRAVLTSDAPASDKAQARDLLRKSSSDPAVLVLLGACVVFFLVVVLTYVGKAS